MTERRKHARALRAIGGLLDRARAHDVIIEEHPQTVTVSWDGPEGAVKTEAYPWAELERDAISPSLRREAAAGRGSGTTTPSGLTKNRGTWGQLLRTLGQDLDALQVAYSAVTGDLDALTVSWVADGHYASRHYTGAELWEANQRRAAARQAAA
jgi:hypothetical protein